MILRQISISFGIAALLFAGDSSLSGQSPSARIPVPTDSAQAESMKLVKEVYGGKYDKAKTPVQKTALAEKLLQKAGASKNDPASHYVMLRLARDIAAQAGDANAALRAVDAMDSAYQVDAYAMKVETLVKAAKAACLSKQYPVIVERAKVMLEEAVAKDDFDSATQLAEAALAAAKSSKDLAIVKQVASRNKEVEEIGKVYEEEAKEAIAKLKKKPIDPEANLAVGKYLCFIKGDWDYGISKLALGSDAKLKAVATKDIQGTASAEEQVKVGDGWWDLVPTSEQSMLKQLQARSGYWYRKALPELVPGLVKDKVEKRLGEIVDLGQEIQPVTVKPPLAIAPFSETTAKMHQIRWANYLGVPVVQANSIGMKLSLIPPGEFQMGSPKKLIDEELRLHGSNKWYADHLSGEGPQHRVRITKPYWLGVTEVTQEQYQRVMGSNPSKFQGDPKRPVEQVSWDNAVEFCRRLTGLPEEQAAKRRYALPTEAQWEYACRAGNAGRWCFNPQRNPLSGAVEEKMLGEYGWFKANSGGQTHPVGQKRANAFGLHDIHGNMWEWCEDMYDKDYYAKSATDDPAGSPGASTRVARGGGWDSDGWGCQSAYRYGFGPGGRRRYLGFRVSRVPAE